MIRYGIQAILRPGHVFLCIVCYVCAGDELLNHPCWSQLTYTATSHLAAPPFLTHGAVSLTLPFLAGYLSRMTLTFILTHTASKRVADTTIRTLSLCLPPLAILVTAANKLALNVELTRGFPVLVAGVLAVHAGAFALGYLITMLAGADRTTCQVSSIQVRGHTHTHTHTLTHTCAW